ncbi:MAG: hypothetical protein ACLFNQ_09540 [Spirochaetaceae bacterium]
MTKREAIAAQKAGPNTVDTLTADLQRLGLRPEMLVLVHTSLSSLGWTSGGPHAVADHTRHDAGV